eukprot:9484587-Pyramimonas_sp.AAC.2
MPPTCNAPWKKPFLSGSLCSSSSSEGRASGVGWSRSASPSSSRASRKGRSSSSISASSVGVGGRGGALHVGALPSTIPSSLSTCRSSSAVSTMLSGRFMIPSSSVASWLSGCGAGSAAGRAHARPSSSVTIKPKVGGSSSRPSGLPEIIAVAVSPKSAWPSSSLSSKSTQCGKAEAKSACRTEASFDSTPRSVVRLWIICERLSAAAIEGEDNLNWWTAAWSLSSTPVDFDPMPTAANMWCSYKRLSSCVKLR